MVLSENKHETQYVTYGRFDTERNPVASNR